MQFGNVLLEFEILQRGSLSTAGFSKDFRTSRSCLECGA